MTETLDPALNSSDGERVVQLLHHSRLAVRQLDRAAPMAEENSDPAAPLLLTSRSAVEDLNTHLAERRQAHHRRRRRQQWTR